MRVSMRVKLAVVVALFAAVFMVGSAWAAQTADAVKQAIENFGLAASISGNTITVTNAATNPLVKDINSYGSTRPDGGYYLLNLGDLTGLTIDWKAHLTVTGVQNVDDGVDVILFGNGMFNVTGGKIELQATGIGHTNAIEGEGRSTITMEGGTVKGIGTRYFGIGADWDDSGEVIVKGGTISFPDGEGAISTNKFTMTGGSIDGLVVYGISDDTIEVYGTTDSSTPIAWDEPPASLKYFVKSGAKWTVSSDVILMASDKYALNIENGGMATINGTAPIENHGTITVAKGGKLVNNARINNHSSKTIDNQGELVNNGTIDNKSTGKITNTGTIDNTNGTIVNEGTFESVQTKEEMKGSITGNAVEPIDDTSNTSSGGSSGCDTGFGMFALAALALPFMKRK